MNTSLYIALIIIALSTYFIRVLPYLWMKKTRENLKRRGSQ